MMKQAMETRLDAEAGETIFALASGRGRAGIAVIRISGTKTKETLVALTGRVPPVRMATLLRLHDPVDGQALDEALVLFFEAPRSFTGEDMAEFHVHGGPAVITGVIDALAKLSGMRLATAGEFSRRAFGYGKLDLTAVEGMADLIDAETRAQRVQALRQSAGALGDLYESWRSDLITALALVEAALDFSDEADVPVLIEREAVPVAERLEVDISKHLQDGGRGERLREGFCVVLAGPPNAGKSSLLNALAARDVAIVSEEAGTTRDVLEVHLDLDGWPLTLLDTAGLREAEGAIEAEGVRRALERARMADLILWLVDAGDPQWPPHRELDAAAAPVLTILNKCDLARPGGPDNILEISAKTGEGLDGLMTHLTGQVTAVFEISEAPVITRARHRQELQGAQSSLERFLNGSTHTLELRAEDLRSGAQALGRITGRVDVEDILDRIFSDFCIGK